MIHLEKEYISGGIGSFDYCNTMLSWIQLKYLFVFISIRLCVIESKSINGSRSENSANYQLIDIQESDLINITRSENFTKIQQICIQRSESINGSPSNNFTKNQLIDIKEPKSIDISETRPITTPKVLCRSLTPSISCFNLVPLKLFHSHAKKSSKTKFDQLLQFHAFDRTFNVKLYQLNTGHDIIPPSVKISIRSNGTTKSRNITKMGIQLFEGYLISEQGFSFVHGAVHRDEYEMTIRTETTDIYVEPASKHAHLRCLHDTTDTENHVIVYRNTDIVLPTLSENSTCYKSLGSGNRSARFQMTTTAYNKSVRAFQRWKMWKRKRELALQRSRYVNCLCLLTILSSRMLQGDHRSALSWRLPTVSRRRISCSAWRTWIPTRCRTTVGLFVKEIRIFETADDPGYLFGRTDLNYDQTLEAMSRYDLDKFCLGIRFFNRNFADGVIRDILVGESVR